MKTESTVNFLQLFSSFTPTLSFTVLAFGRCRFQNDQGSLLLDHVGAVRGWFPDFISLIEERLHMRFGCPSQFKKPISLVKMEVHFIKHIPV